MIRTESHGGAAPAPARRVPGLATQIVIGLLTGIVGSLWPDVGVASNTAR